MVCPCTLYSDFVVCPGTSELVGQHGLHGMRFSANFDNTDNLKPCARVVEENLFAQLHGAHVSWVVLLVAAKSR